MTRHRNLIAAALLAGGVGLGGAAAADCAAELDALAGVAKDGTAAPLGEAGATPQTGAGEAGSAAGSEGVSKDGGTMPLEASPDVATSAEDAQAQSEGGETAAAQAAGAAGGGEETRQTAINQARAALAAGDEAACMEAVERAKAM